MKFKKTLILLFVLSLLGSVFLLKHSSLLESALKTELLARTPPQASSDGAVLPYGYTMGYWPETFKGEPIVTQMTYSKGPPAKFMDSITQVWRPVDAELKIYGPLTVIKDFSLADWRKCFSSDFFCTQQKRLFWKRVFPESSGHSERDLDVWWFESNDPNGARGVHLKVLSPHWRVDRFAVITPAGIVQIFSMKTALNPIGLEALDQFIGILGGLTISDQIASGRQSIEDKIKKVDIEVIKKTANPKERLRQLIRIQAWISSYLSVNPASADSFFHLAGITHRVALDLLKSKERFFENQESWLVGFQPLLSTLLRYSRDFPENEARIKNIEALLEDFLLQQKKLSRNKLPH